MTASRAPRVSHAPDGCQRLDRAAGGGECAADAAYVLSYYRGIAGLAFVLFWFFAPIVRMFKKGRFSFLVLGLSLVLIVVSNSCVTLAWSNLRTCALMLLSMFYLYGAAFTAQENDVPQRRPSNLKQRVQ